MRTNAQFFIAILLLGFLSSVALSPECVAQRDAALPSTEVPAAVKSPLNRAVEGETSARDMRKVLTSMSGKLATVTLSSGKAYENAEIARVTFHKKTGDPVRVYVKLDRGRRRSFLFAAVRSITVDEQLVYQGAMEEDEEGLSKEAQEAKAHELWVARLTARGVTPWRELSEEEHQVAIEAHKERYEKVALLLPSLRLVETEHFLFCTNIPSQQVGGFIASLDRMYAYMQKAYGVDPKTPVWRGKASIFAFVREDEFIAFERQIMKHEPPAGAGGFCHYDGRRNVCIAVHQGTDADYFGILLVHETSHGFIHCYKTPVRVPSWVNEGMAEVIASMMVPSSDAVQRREKKFLKKVTSVPQPLLGEEFFAVDQNIPFDRYGGASSMTRFLLKIDQKKYIAFINRLKEGMPWEEALEREYGANKEQLVSAYGKWIGVPALRP